MDEYPIQTTEIAEVAEIYEYPEPNEYTARTLSADLKAEETVVGCMMLGFGTEPAEIGLELLTAQDFYSFKCRCIFEAAKESYEKLKHVDATTVANILLAKGLYEEIGGWQTLIDISTSISTASNIRAYAKIVSENSLQRQAVRTFEKLTKHAYNMGKAGHPQDSDKLLQADQDAIFGLSGKRLSGEMTRIAEAMQGVVEDTWNAQENKGQIPGIPTGFAELDKITAGFQKSDLILIAARPSMGKTALALNIATDAAMRRDIPVAVFSLEMSIRQLATRIVSSEGMINAGKFKMGTLNTNEWSRFYDTIKRIAKAPLFLDDTSGISYAQIRSKCQKLKLSEGLGLIVIDYMQLMSGGMPGSKRSENRQQEISEISRNLKALAREMDCPVIALSQLNRAVEGRADKRPILSDLRESGAIEQDADLVCFVYRDEYYNPDTEMKGLAEFIIAKQRNGAIGTVYLKYLGEYVKFVNPEYFYS